MSLSRRGHQLPAWAHLGCPQCLGLLLARLLYHRCGEDCFHPWSREAHPLSGEHRCFHHEPKLACVLWGRAAATVHKLCSNARSPNCIAQACMQSLPSARSERQQASTLQHALSNAIHRGHVTAGSGTTGRGSLAPIQPLCLGSIRSRVNDRNLQQPVSLASSLPTSNQQSQYL